jgi:hypothetical protein
MGFAAPHVVVFYLFQKKGQQIVIRLYQLGFLVLMEEKGYKGKASTRIQL